MRRGPKAGNEAILGWGLKALSKDMIEDIHNATLEIMQTTGIRFDSDRALDIFEKGGCWVNRKTKVVRFPRHLVNDAITSCPNQIIMAGRDSRHDFMMGGREVGFTPFGVGVTTQDLETGELRDSTKADLEEMGVLIDALPHMDIYTPPVTPRDVPNESYDLHMAETAFVNCSKHIGAEIESKESALQIFEMAAAITGGSDEMKARPIVSTLVCPTSPLQYIENATDLIELCAEKWIPMTVLSMAMAGGSSPISISGTLVTHNAEVLAGIVLGQIINPGTPMIYGSSTTTFDMRYSAAVVGAPELGMISAAVVELANFYGLPNYVAGG
ncbi:MAG: trimethylamine methyltransferase family protein [Desulfobacterales bacterium]|nr:trimethylamine methyltransferase family protein [Desulfobacterales bacterium]